MPPALRHALPDEPFDSTDVYVKGHKHRRYIFVWNIGNQWIVAVELGGIALRAGICTYDLGKDDKTAVRIDEAHYFSRERVRGPPPSWSKSEIRSELRNRNKVRA
jgi:hypothetical protein